MVLKRQCKRCARHESRELNMKKLVLLSVVLFAACVCLQGQNPAQYNARESLKNEVKYVNQNTPWKIDYMTTMVLCELDGNDLVYNYIVDENYISIEELRSTKRASMKKNLEATWNSSGTATTRSNLKTIGGKVIYKYRGNISQKTMVIVVDLD